MTKWYLSAKDPNDELVSPIVAKDFVGFAPAFIITGEFDELKSHGEDLLRKLQASKVSAYLVEVKGKDHFGNLWATAHPKVEAVISSVITFIKK